MQVVHLRLQLRDFRPKRCNRCFDQLGNFLLCESSRHTPVLSDIAQKRNTTLGGFGVNGYVPLKGNLWKSFFHLPRMQWYCWQALAGG